MNHLNFFGKNAGIKNKLFGMIGIITSIAIAGTIVTWLNLKEQTQVMLAMKSQTEILTGLKTLQSIISEANLNAMDIIVDRDAKKVADERVEKNGILRTWLDANKTKYVEWGGQINESEDLKTIFDKLDASQKGTTVLISAVNNKVKNEKVYSDADDTIDESCGTSGELLSKIQDGFTATYNKNKDELEKLNNQVLMIVLCANFVSVLALLLIGVSITLAITRSISKSTTNLDKTANTLSGVITGLESGEQTLTSSVSTQASAITESVAAMTEIQSVLRRNAESLQNVIAKVRQGADLSTEGQTIMHQMGESMTKLAESNENLTDISGIIEAIGKKTDIINNIVFKTQMLSFNASIEAARAGVHGKGFAVVASEVGRLAEISGKASNEIQELLDESKKKVSTIVTDITGRVRETSTITTEATSKFSGLGESIQEIAERILGVKRGAQEQTTGVDQCVKSLNQMDSVSSQTYEVTRTISKLCHTLKQQNIGLANTISSTKQIVFGIEFQPESHATVDLEDNSKETSKHQNSSVDRTKLLDKLVKKSKTNESKGENSNSSNGDSSNAA